MASPSSSSSKEDPVTVEVLQDAGRRLISLPSSVVEQLNLLDEVENVLTKVAQSSPKPVIEELKPIVEVLVTDRLLKNDDIDVKISVASCISQILRITAPDSPYGDEQMKIYFQLSVSAFEKLSSLSGSGRQYTKAVSILESFAKIRTCIIMLDLELNTEIIKMFRLFFDSVGSHLPPIVLFYVERTMITVLEESEELPEELIKLLLNRLKKENRKVQPLAWELATIVAKNCVTILKKYIPEAVALMNLDLNDYAEIVSSICQAASGKQNLEVKEPEPQTNEQGKASGSAPVTTMKKTSTSEKIDAYEEKEDEEPIVAVVNEDISQSKKRGIGESSTKRTKKRRTKAIEHGKASGPASVTTEDAALNGNDDGANAKKTSKSEKIDTYEEKEDEEPTVAVVKEDNSQSKKRGIGESSTKRTKKRKTQAIEHEKKENEEPIVAVVNEDNSQSKSGKGESSTKRTKKRKTQSEIVESTEETKTELNTDVIPNKRFRKPNCLVTPDEGYLEISELKRKSKKKGDADAPNSSVSKKTIEQKSENKTSNLSEETKGKEKRMRKEESIKNQDGEVQSANIPEEDGPVTDTIPKTKQNREGNRQRGEAGKSKLKSISTELIQAGGRKRTSVVKKRGVKLVGRKIKVWWPEDRIFYPGEITSFDRATNKYQVLYQDGDIEILDLEKEQWEAVEDGEEITSAPSTTQVLPNQQFRVIGESETIQRAASESNAIVPSTTVIGESETIQRAASESNAIVEVKGYKVKASIADTLEEIFSKYGDIASQCPYRSLSLKSTLLEIVCGAVQKLRDNNCAPDFKEIETVISDAEEAKLDIGWLSAELDKRMGLTEETGRKLREAKREIEQVAKAAQLALDIRKEELASAQKSFEEAEKRYKGLKCVKKKVEGDLLETEALLGGGKKKRRSKKPV